MFKLEDRGPMMIEPGWKIYRGMIVGEHTRDNALRSTFSRAAAHQYSYHQQGRGGPAHPADPHVAGKGAGLIEDDELVEVTPKSIRLRKKLLDPTDRKRSERSKEAEAVV